MINRRDLLFRYGPAAFLGWPVLGGRRAEAGSAPPRRLVTVYSSSGVRTDIFWPKGSFGNAGAYSVAGTSLAPLADSIGDLIIPRGISIDSGVGDGHDAGSVAVLTGNHMTSEKPKTPPYARGPSLDQFLAKKLQPPTPEPFLNLGVRLRINRISKWISYDERGAANEPHQNPYTTYDRIFRNVAANCTRSGKAAPVDPKLARVRFERKSVLDTVRTETAAFKRGQGLDGEERQKLERMEEAIRSVEKRLEVRAGHGGAGCVSVKTAMEDGERVEDNDTKFPELLRLQMDLVALALELDVTRIVTLALSLGGSGGAPMTWLACNGAPIEASHHSVTHGKQRGVLDHLPKLQVIDRWNMEQFAYLVGRLKSIADGGQKLLDNSIVWYATDVGNGGTHSRTDLPYLVAGRAGGAFKTGRYVQFDDVPHQRLLLSFCHAMGAKDVEVFGRPESCVAGPLL